MLKPSVFSAVIDGSAFAYFFALLDSSTQTRDKFVFGEVRQTS
jgi:hypothetical protein